MADAGQLNARAEVATSRDGPWQPVGTVRGLFVSDASTANAPPVAIQTAKPPHAPPDHVPPPRPTASIPLWVWLAGFAGLAAVALVGIAVLLLAARGSSVRLRDAVAAAINETKQDADDPEYVVFRAAHVKSHYNLDESDLQKIQVWNFGEIDLVEIDHQTDEKSGDVVDGKVVARNAETEIRKPVKIPHLTPGVFAGFADGFRGVWVDFGGIQVCFQESLFLSRGPLRGVNADGEYENADALPDKGDSESIPVRVANEAGERWETWYCKFRSPGENAGPGGRRWQRDQPFLVYKGGILDDDKKVEEREERRATGKVVE